MWNGPSLPPRFRSQAFATSQRFLSNFGLRGLVSSHSRPGFFSPTEVSPHGNRAPLSRPLTPLPLSTSNSQSHPTILISPDFTDAHAHARLPGSPSTYELPLSEQARLPVTLEPSSEAPCAPPASPTSALYSSRESVRTDPSCLEPAADPLLVLRPSEAFSVHTSVSRTPPVRPRANRTCQPTRERISTTRRTSRPSAPGEPAAQREMQRNELSTDSSPLRDWPAPPLGDVPTPLALAIPAETGPTDLRSLEVCGKRLSSPATRKLRTRCLLLWGSLPRRQPRDFEIRPGPSLWIHRQVLRPSPAALTTLGPERIPPERSRRLRFGEYPVATLTSTVKRFYAYNGCNNLFFNAVFFFSLL